jgi:hypothetical protein
MIETSSDIVYVVKSHQRVDRFYDKTYKEVILKYGFPLERVYVFVSTDKDLELYRKKYKLVNIIKAPMGVAAVDNYITQYFDEGQKIIYMNDDVSGVQELHHGKLQPIEKSRFTNIITAMFSKMKANRITYGGFYPVPNPMFMPAKKMTYNLCLIMDPLSLVINNKKIRITISDKSDFEKSIQHFVSQGALLRYNRIALKVEYYGKIGGFQGRNAKTEAETALLMQKKYPEYIAGINTKKGGKTSLRLKPIKEKYTVV